MPFFLARRWLSGRSGGLLGTVSALAIFGVALGTAALVVAMGLMSGYRSDLAEKLAGTNAEVLVIPPDGVSAEDRAALRTLPGVAAVARSAFAPGLLLSPRVPAGADVVVKGLELPDGLLTTRLLGAVPGVTRRLAARPDGRVPALLGAGLARRLAAAEGSLLALETASPGMGKGISAPRRTLLVAAALVETGFSEVDDGWALVPMDAFERLAPPDARGGIWELKLAAASRSDETVRAARARFGPAATIVDWKQLNRELFAALAMQQTLLFVALALIVAVAAGTVVSSLSVLLAGKTRDVGVLAALGAPPAAVGRTFRSAGLLLGGSGLVAGAAFGVLACRVLTATRAVRFPPEIAKVYYLSWMPFRPEPLHVAGILAFGVGLVLVASLLPARRASRLSPADALRYE